MTTLALGVCLLVVALLGSANIRRVQRARTRALTSRVARLAAAFDEVDKQKATATLMRLPTRRVCGVCREPFERHPAMTDPDCNRCQDMRQAAEDTRTSEMLAADGWEKK